MEKQDPTPVMEVEVASPFGFQPEFVEEEETSSSDVVTGEDTLQEPELPVEPETPPPSEPAPSSPQAQNDDSSVNKTHAAVLAESFVQRGGLPPDLEIPPDLTGEQLVAVLDRYRAEQVQSNIHQYYEQKYGADKMKYLDYLEAGGSPETLMSTISFDKMEIEGEGEEVINNRKQLILAMYKDKDVPEKRALRLFDDLLEDEEDLEEAKVAKAYFKEKIQVEAQQRARQRSLMEQREREQIEQTNQEILAKIRSRKLGEGFELTPQQAQSLESYMFQPTAVIEVPQPDGSLQPARVSQYYKDYTEFHQNTDNLVKLARFIQLGGNMGLDEELSQLKTNDGLLDQLNKVTSKQDERSTKRNAYYSFGTS